MHLRFITKTGNSDRNEARGEKNMIDESGSLWISFKIDQTRSEKRIYLRRISVFISAEGLKYVKAVFFKFEISLVFPAS